MQEGLSGLLHLRGLFGLLHLRGLSGLLHPRGLYRLLHLRGLCDVLGLMHCRLWLVSYLWGALGCGWSHIFGGLKALIGLISLEASLGCGSLPRELLHRE